MKLFLLLIVVLATTAAQACSRDAWYRGAPSPILQRLQERPLSGDAFAEVPPTRRNEAVALLNGKAALALSAVQLARLHDGRPNTPGTGHPYLLRAVRYPTPNSGFEVYETAGAVLVSFGYLGGQGGRSFHTAVVAWLISVPDQVFVSCAGAI